MINARSVSRDERVTLASCAAAAPANNTPLVSRSKARRFMSRPRCHSRSNSSLANPCAKNPGNLTIRLKAVTRILCDPGDLRRGGTEGADHQRSTHRTRVGTRSGGHRSHRRRFTTPCWDDRATGLPSLSPFTTTIADPPRCPVPVITNSQLNRYLSTFAPLTEYPR